MTLNRYILALIIFCFSCHEKLPNSVIIETVNNDVLREIQIDSSSIIDTLLAHDELLHYETYFNEIGWALSSYLYQGKVEGILFGIKTNCNDGTVVIYHKKNGKWKVFKHIDEDLGWNFRTFKLQDINNDKYNDVVLLDHDNWRRVVFTFNPKDSILEHNGIYDRLNKRN